MPSHFGFLEEFILNLLKKNGFETLTEEQQLAYVPQFTAQLEERLGLELMPKLSDEQTEAFAEMIERDGVGEEEWLAFWKQAVSTFDEDVMRVMQTFASDMERILSQQKTG